MMFSFAYETVRHLPTSALYNRNLLLILGMEIWKANQYVVPQMSSLLA